MQRRRLLKIGLAATALLTLAGGGLALLRPGLVRGRLTPDAISVFEAIARAVLDGSLPIDIHEREAAVSAHLKRLDDAVASFPAATQAELSQLLALLVSAPGRSGLAGLLSPWPEATVSDLQQALQGMRTSTLALRQQTYHALRDLTNAAYYADFTAWPLLGYPGPTLV